MKMMQVTLSGKAYKMFIDSCRTEKTRETYTGSLKAYLMFRRLRSPEELISEEPKIAQAQQTTGTPRSAYCRVKFILLLHLEHRWTA